MTAAAPHKARIPDVPFVDRVYGLKVIGGGAGQADRRR